MSELFALAMGFAIGVMVTALCCVVTLRDLGFFGEGHNDN